MEWKQIKPNHYEREDGYAVAIRDDGKWWAARPNGLILRDDGLAPRIFGSPEGAKEFCDRFHQPRCEAPMSEGGRFYIELQKDGDEVVARWMSKEVRGRSCEEASRIMGAYLDELLRSVIEAIRKDAENL